VVEFLYMNLDVRGVVNMTSENRWLCEWIKKNKKRERERRGGEMSIYTSLEVGSALQFECK
jgi:hypothetical protein